MRSKAIDWFIFALSLIWGTALFAGVAVVQKDFFLPEVAALAGTLRAVLVAGWILLAGLGLGWALTRPLELSATGGERWLVAALLGMGALGLIWLLTGLVRVPPVWLTLPMLAAPLLLLRRYRKPLPALPALPRPLWLLLGGALAISFTGALTPVTAFDALMYHLRLPELWLAEGNLFQEQKAAHFFFPVLAQSLYLPAVQLGGEVAAALLHWLYFPLILILVWQMSRRYLPSGSGPLALTLVLTMQMVLVLASQPYTDLLFAAYQVSALWALLRWRDEPGSRWHLVAGAFAGMALGVKYLAAFTPIIAILFILFLKRRDALLPVLQFAFVAGLVGSPSYLRNLIATGNPFFPFALPSPYWDEFRATWYAAAGSGIGWSLRELLAVPWLTTLGLRDTSYFDGRTGPLIATFAPLSAWLLLRGYGEREERRAAALLWAFASAYLLIWLFGVINSEALWQGRFLVTPFLLLVPVIAWGIRQLDSLATATFSPLSFSHLFIGAWAVLATTIAGVELVRTAPLQALFGQQETTAWRAEQLGSFPELVDATRQLPEDARLLLLVEPRSYGMPVRTEPDTILYQYPWRLHRAGGSVERMAEGICDEAFTHVGIFWHGAQYLNEKATINALSDEEFALLESWSEEQEKIWSAEDGGHELLRLNCNRSRAENGD